LGKKGQFIPLDPPFAREATLGGTIATNATGPKRLLYGTARDLLLGVRVVHADGRISRGGGKVVKNVAGYDMNKLYIGSYGTLGILVEMTMKLLPKPETEKLLFATFADLSSAVKVVSQLLQSKLRPSAIELFNSAAGALLSQELGITITTGPLILVGIDDIIQAAERQYNQIQRLCIAEDSVEIISLSEEKQRNLWTTIRNFSRTLLSHTPGTVICRANVVTSKVGELFRIAEEAGAEHHIHVALTAHFGNGVVSIACCPREGETLTIDIIKALVHIFTQTAAQFQGNLIVEAVPEGVKEVIDVWGPIPQTVAEVMRGLKAQFDPTHTLNPGRFVAGI
jgi:glycolate oxidase FAD binding subunit